MLRYESTDMRYTMTLHSHDTRFERDFDTIAEARVAFVAAVIQMTDLQYAALRLISGAAARIICELQNFNEEEAIHLPAPTHSLVGALPPRE